MPDETPMQRLTRLVETSQLINGLNTLRRELPAFTDDEVAQGWAYSLAQRMHWDRCAEVMRDELERRGLDKFVDGAQFLFGAAEDLDQPG